MVFFKVISYIEEIYFDIFLEIFIFKDNSESRRQNCLFLC